MLALRGTAMPSPSVLRLRGAATLSPSVLWELGFCVLSMLQGCCLSPDSGPGPLWVPAARGVLVSGNFATLQQSEEPGWPMSVQRAVCGEPCGFGIKPSGKILGCLVFCWGGGGEREEQITSNVGLNSFLVALGRFVKNVIEGNKVNRALRQSERCRPCWGSPSVEVFHGNGHGLCMCYMLWLVRRGISGGGGGEPALGTGFAERAEWRQTSSGGGGPNPEATSAWGAGEGLRLRGEALMAALGSLRSVCHRPLPQRAEMFRF